MRKFYSCRNASCGKRQRVCVCVCICIPLCHNLVEVALMVIQQKEKKKLETEEKKGKAAANLDGRKLNQMKAQYTSARRTRICIRLPHVALAAHANNNHHIPPQSHA